MDASASKLLRAVKFSGIFFFILFFLFLFVTYTNVLLPFIMAFVLAYILNPFVDYFESKGLSREMSVITLFVLTLLICAIFFYLMFPKIKEEAIVLQTELPTYFKMSKNMMFTLIEDIDKKMPFLKLDKLGKSLNTSQELTTRLTKGLPNYAGIIFNAVTNVLLTPFILFLLLKDGRKLRKAIISIVPNRYFEMALCLMHDINEQIRSYFRGRIIELVAVAILSVIGLYIIGIRYAVILGIILGITNIIPYLGPFLGGIPAVFVALVDYQTLNVVVKVVGMLMLIQFVDNAIIVPIAVGKTTNLHPLLVVLAVLVGGEMMGVLGMIFAVPLLGILIVTFKTLYRGFSEYRF
ncbi:MAG: AI-2E family transporter [Candidatus Firestonebacteria bacterium]